MEENKIKEVLENNGFNVERDDNVWNVQQYTPAGEDWYLSFYELKDIVEYAENYDPEEDFTMWVEARQRDKSVPPPAELWKDQLWKQEILNKVAEEICQTDNTGSK